MYNFLEIKELLGKALLDVSVNDDEDEIRFTADDGSRYLMYHNQDCCEHVRIEDICGDINDLIGSDIVMAEEVSYSDEKELPTPERIRIQLEKRNGILDNSYGDESITWTFYKIGTNKGSITIRWIGESNGYYSESVDFVKL